VWFSCQTSWKEKYPDYKYILWTDEDLDAFMKKKYPSYYSMYSNYDKNIKRIDMARYFILHYYGGIYADMDYECLHRFDDQLPPDKVSICESPHKKWEKVQNALMASPAGHPFWLLVIEEATHRTKNKNVLKSTGPILLTDVYLKNKEMVNILNVDMYNPKSGSQQFKNPNIYTRHFGTVSWVES
jgi:mannosyltransferase OCH1-like enzyme